jgi:hypothetical protein
MKEPISMNEKAYLHECFVQNDLLFIVKTPTLLPKSSGRPLYKGVGDR